MLQSMSFNLRYGTAEDGENAWPNRRDAVAEHILAAGPDLLGVQECLGFQADFLRERLSQHAFVGAGRDDGERRGEMTAVFFRRDRFDLVDARHIWLSEMPDTPGSRGWDAQISRTATCLTLTDREGDRQFLMINTHFDHRGQIAQVESARLLASRINPDTPTILTGDLNVSPDSEPYRILAGDGLQGGPLRDTRRVVGHDETDAATFHAFKLTTDGRRIDFILASPHWRVANESIDHAAPNGRPLSDHYPIRATLAWGTDGAGAVHPGVQSSRQPPSEGTTWANSTASV